MSLLLKKIRNGYYTTKIGYFIVNENSKWYIKTEVEGDAIFEDRTLKMCKNYLNKINKLINH